MPQHVRFTDSRYELYQLQYVCGCVCVAAEVANQAQRWEAFSQLIKQLPAAHQAAPRVIMDHVTRLLRHQQNHKHKTELSSLSQVFYHFFMRPPWPDIMLVCLKVY